MADVKFDNKSFNAEAFKYSVNRVPNMKMNEIIKSGALAGNAEIRSTFTTQNGTGYARIAMRGLIDGAPVNYDGATDIEATSTKTYEQGVVVVGRAKAWTEKDFSYDITGSVDFMDNVAQQVAEYRDGIDQDTLLAVLSGVFSMTGTKNAEFVTKHTTDVTGVGAGILTATTLNTAMNAACGAFKDKFSLVFLHPDVATNLENLNLIEHLKHTDANGLTRDLAMGTWSGRTVIIDDGVPTEEMKAGYVKVDKDTPGALKVVTSGATDGQIDKAKVTPVANQEYSPAADDYVILQEAHTRYTSYVLGRGSVWHDDIGAKVPYEMARDPKKNGGEDTLYMRQRKVFAPMGISYEKKNQATNSPTDAELKNGENWTLVHTGETQDDLRTYIDHKAITIARIISKG